MALPSGKRDSQKKDPPNKKLILQSQLLQANAQLHWLKRQLLGKKSKKITSKEDQKQFLLEGFEVEEISKETFVKGHSRKQNQKGKDRITLPYDLPLEKEVHDIPIEQKICPDTKNPLEKIGEEITSKLAYKPGSYYIKQIIRPKYATHKGSIETASLPESLLAHLKNYTKHAKAQISNNVAERAIRPTRPRKEKLALFRE